MDVVEFERIREWVRKVVHGKNLGDVMEIGPGMVPLKNDVRMKYRSYVTMDVDPKFEPDFVMDVCEDVPGGPYDTAFLIETLEHVRNPMRAMQNVVRALRQGGIIIATTPFLIQEHAEKGDFFRFTKRWWLWIANELWLEVEKLDLRRPDGIEVVEDFLRKHTRLRVESELVYTGVNVVVRKK